MEQLKQFDNINNRVIDDLRQHIKVGSKLSIAAASFSIYAYEALKKELERIDELRFIFTSPTFNKEKSTKQKREFYIPKLNRERNLYGSDFEIKLRNQLSQKAVARECAEWIQKKVHFKTNISEGMMNGFFTLSNPGQLFTYMPFNEFTTTELGCEKGNNMCPGVMRMPSPFSEQYIRNFNELWNNEEKFKEVTDIIIDNIETVYKENSPDFIYFVTLYNIFKEFLEDISEDVLPNEATGFKNSEIWNKLYNFQRDAALAIINKLEKYNGCILADSVGLGKTFTALAVIKYYENRNKSVLVLCPKKLNENWITFRSNYINNPVAKDRLRYDILFHSDLSREQGFSNGLDLSHINWGNYDLIVIDESHNFRNGGKITTDEENENPKENRYLRLMNKVIRTGVRTKVLMLSATPVNNRFNDLKNQLQLAYEGNAETINSLLDTQSGIDDIFRQAQATYNRWSKLNAEERTAKRLLESLNFDFFHVLDAVTIARSRNHVERYYDMTDIGKFPTHLSPISRRPKLTDLDEAMSFKEISKQLSSLNLSIYTPSNYILKSRAHRYTIEKDKRGNGLSMSGREKGIRKLMAINLLKRLESSVNSFRLTLARIQALLKKTIQIINTYENTNNQAEVNDFDFTDSLDMEDREQYLSVGGKKTKIHLEDMDYLSWRNDLASDLTILDHLLNNLKSITPQHDSKLQMLITELNWKFSHPLNSGNKKVLVFTAFSDTADYLYEQLVATIHQTTGLHIGLVTGDTDGQCTIPSMKINFNSLLTLFSPQSKERDKLLPNTKEEIDVLIATDCISEGQNLQDCDCLINFDIHWNPVRIIQRFGRIDRIGSKNEVIQLINYWPDMELDDYIQLKGRVEARMKAMDLTGAGGDDVLSDNEKIDLEYRKEQLKRLQNEIVNIEDMDTGINIMDLGLNEFRLDLLAYIKEHPDIEHTPFGMSAIVPHSDLAQPGVIYILKNRNNEVNVGKQNLIHPFYMVYLNQKGEILCNHLEPKRMLDTIRMLCKGKQKPIKELCKQFNQETNDGRNMTRYSELLQCAINSIIEVKEESDIASLFSVGETTALTNMIAGLNDFELIAFLIIK